MDEKSDGLGARILEDLLVVLPLELAGSSESVVVLVLPHLLRSSSEDDGSTSFLEQKAADETESSVDDELNPCGKKNKKAKGTEERSVQTRETGSARRSELLSNKAGVSILSNLGSSSSSSRLYSPLYYRKKMAYIGSNAIPFLRE